jgi:hypothetical protein
LAPTTYWRVTRGFIGSGPMSAQRWRVAGGTAISSMLE